MCSAKVTEQSIARKTLKRYDYLPVDEQGIIFSPESHHIHVLNELSVIIWELYVIAAIPAEEIGKEIASAFDIPVEVAEQDVLSTINYWINVFPGKKYEETDQEESTTPNLASGTYRYHTNIYLPLIQVEVSANSQDIINDINGIFQHLRAPGEGCSATYQVLIVDDNNGQFLICLKDRLLETATSQSHIPVMVHRAITELACQHSEWVAILHAGGASYEGKTLLFPSQGGNGKSTLIAGLIQSGFTYINDDVVPLLTDQTLVPVPVSLCVKSGSWEVLDSYYPGLKRQKVYGRNNLQVKYLQPPTYYKKGTTLRAHCLIRPLYNPDCSTPKLEWLSTIDALQVIIQAESLIAKPFTKKNIHSLISWLKSIDCFSLEYSDLDRAIQCIKTLVRRP